ncbi:MAG TPA: hypothetical protein VGE01_03970 [Fimbriimonas sp.]
MLLVAVFAGYFVLKLAFVLIGKLLSLIVPLLLIGGIAYILFSIINRKALSSGSRRTLP